MQREKGERWGFHLRINCCPSLFVSPLGFKMATSSRTQITGHCKGCSYLKIVCCSHESAGCITNQQKLKLFCKWYAPNEAHTQVSLMHVPFSSNQSEFPSPPLCTKSRRWFFFFQKLLKMALFLHMTHMWFADLIAVDHIYVTQDVQH